MTKAEVLLTVMVMSVYVWALIKFKEIAEYDHD